MSRAVTLFLLLPTLASVGCAGLPNEVERALPASVVAKIDSLIEECELDDARASAEERQASLDSVETYDLNGDAFADYLIVDSSVACPAGVSFRHGNSGPGVIVMAGDEGGAHTAADAIAHAVRVEARTGEPDRVWLLLGGGYCGQDTEGVSRFEMTICERSLIWHAESATFVLAPEDQTNFAPELPE